jgi:hypothetical protein
MYQYVNYVPGIKCKACAGLFSLAHVYIEQPVGQYWQKYSLEFPQQRLIAGSRSGKSLTRSPGNLENSLHLPPILLLGRIMPLV